MTQTNGKMSPELKEFYKSYQEWLDDGAPQALPYLRETGLCGNMEIYARAEKINEHDIFMEMVEQFLEANLSRCTPFNNGSMDSYWDERAAGAMHLNEERIQWVRDHAKD